MKIFTNKQWKEFIHHQKECTRNAIIKAGIENQDAMANELIGHDKPRPDLVKDAHIIAEDWVGYLFRD